MAKKKLILNRYRPLAKAGSGASATVIAAFDTRMKRNVAIKVIELDAFTAQELAWSMGLEDDDVDEGDDSSISVDSGGNSSSSGSFGNSRGPSNSNNSGSSGSSSRFGSPNNSGSTGSARDDAAHDPGFRSPYEERDAGATDEGAADFDFIDDLPETSPSRLFTPDDAVSASNLPGLTEARAAGNLGSPHIVSVHDLVLKGTTAYLIMEYVDGMTLAEFLEKHGDEMTLDIVAAVADGVASALEVAHHHNVLHLDIKPANILINRQGQVKVTDFGMAAVPDAQGVRHGEGGTIGYMPPEQMNREPLDESCDEWALASVIYEMLSGTNPFDAPDLESAQAAIRETELVLPSLMWEDLDEQADDVLFYALDPDPKERYTTVSDFAEEMVPRLGSPRAGKADLAQILAPPKNEPDDAEPEPDPPRKAAWEPERPAVPLSERLTPTMANVAGRSFAVVVTAALLIWSMLNMPAGDAATAIAMWVVVVAGAAATAFLPCVGPLVSFAAIGVSLSLNADLAPGLTLIAATIAWWCFAARPRRAKAAPNLALATPVCGALSLGPLTPLSAGYFLTVGKAAATAGFSFVTATVLGSLGSRSLMGWEPFSRGLFANSTINVTDGFLYLLQQPAVWAVGISWVIAAVAVSLCCSSGKRWLAAVGSVVGGVIVIGGLVVARLAATGGAEILPAGLDILCAVISAAIVFAASCVLVPGAPE